MLKQHGVNITIKGKVFWGGSKNNMLVLISIQKKKYSLKLNTEFPKLNDFKRKPNVLTFEKTTGLLFSLLSSPELKVFRLDK